MTGEREKFCRKGKTCKDTGAGVTLTGDEIIGEITKDNMALIPIAISPHGRIGSLFERFIYGTDAIRQPPFPPDRKQASAADRVARSPKVPRAILQRADKLWREANPDIHYGDAHNAMTPTRYFDQQLGLVISTAISSHILRAHNKNKTKPPIQCHVSKECQCEYDTNSNQGCLLSSPNGPRMISPSS